MNVTAARMEYRYYRKTDMPSRIFCGVYHTKKIKGKGEKLCLIIN